MKRKIIGQYVWGKKWKHDFKFTGFSFSKPSEILISYYNKELEIIEVYDKMKSYGNFKKPIFKSNQLVISLLKFRRLIYRTKVLTYEYSILIIVVIK